jgi:hypothetical protein
MALEKKAKLEVIQIDNDGTLLIRLKISIVLDGEVLQENWHRTAIAPLADPVAQMAEVNDDLFAKGFTAVPAAQINIISEVAIMVRDAAMLLAAR